MTSSSPNRLIHSASPYLRQHAGNPVDWYPFGEEAFLKARTENKPLLISIGYSSCYWCHVMERETFSNEEVAALLNSWFVSVKVDREEQPDIDAIYMMATQLMTGQGGWPNNVFVTPDLKPFYAGTYFPPDDSNMFGRPGFLSVLMQLHHKWQEEQEEVEQFAEHVAAHILHLQHERTETEQVPFLIDQISASLFQQIAKSYDKNAGGFNGAPKFPQETLLLFLHRYADVKGEKTALELSEHTLYAMASGGIHDHVGGGFHRYATDSEWRIPHFEKMLYNQALLTECYLELYRRTQDPVIEDVIKRMLSFVLTSMRSPAGGFYTAFDAETEEMEGGSYVWTRSEIEEVLKEETAFFFEYYSLAHLPMIPGHKEAKGGVLYLKRPLSRAAEETGTSRQALLMRLTPLLQLLKEQRETRKMPFLDTKIITAWNGLMIGALAKAGSRLATPSYIEAAKKAADYLLSHFYKQGALFRIASEGKAYGEAFLEDYSFLSQGLFTLYQVSGDASYLRSAEGLMDRADMLFWHDAEKRYYYSSQGERWWQRVSDTSDSALPSAAAVMVDALCTRYFLTHESKWKLKAKQVLQSHAPEMQRFPRMYASMIEAALRLEAIEKGEGRQVSDLAASAHHVKVSVRRLQTTKESVTFELVLVLEEGWHAYAPPASLDFLIPVAVTLQEGELLRIHYPEAETVPSLSAEVKIYKCRVPIIAEVKMPLADPLRFTLSLQLCREGLCLAPSEITISEAA